MFIKYFGKPHWGLPEHSRALKERIEEQFLK